ncbi:MAG: ABC transporter permease [Dehalococcoidales bacterium]|nr:MAG: ABC transporter permease [Dehalococcoidales bacterium]
MAATAQGIQSADVRKRRNPVVDFFIRLIKEKPLGLVGLIIVVTLLLAGIFSELIAPYGYNEIILSDRLDGPSFNHLLGCDNLGRDLLSRIIFGARISMIVALSGSAISSTVSFMVGAISGFLGGKYDMTVQRFVDAWMCFPPLVLYLIVMSILGPGLIQVIIVLGVSMGLGGGSRVSRSAVIRIKEDVYFEAARAIGVPTGRILARHVLPNILPIMIIGFSTGLGGFILAEASLSFLGFGIPPPVPSWGGMLSGTGRQYMLQAPWMALWPGLALAIVVYGVNMLGDAVRDLFDPRLRGGLGRFGGLSGNQEKLEKLVEKKKAEAEKRRESLRS